MTLWILLAALSPGLRAAPDAGKTAEPDFARQVLPVLSDKCFVCHGPDTRKKDLVRLDSYVGATRDLGGYKAIDPENLGKSEILSRIHSQDDPMPPEDAEKQLTEAERALLDRWVRQGGGYAEHWAFVPPRKQKPSNVETAATHQVIDAFVAEQLQAKGADLAPEADRATLARRVALVLTGLPLEPDALADFLADKRPDAYERLVDTLLAGPGFGEHQARYWLDAVRYGDTHGLHLDNRRGIYPYRDWVVRAFNDNMPLDDFITWQLAGDLLPEPTLAQRLATGFVRMNPTTSEGGVLPEEFQAKNNFDRVETLGTVFLGMTLTCARCHTHKYDPITQTEYYRLMAFFNSTAEKSLDGNAYVYGPVVKVPKDQSAWDDWVSLTRERDQFLGKAEALMAHARARDRWQSGSWQVSRVVDAGTAGPYDTEWLPARNLPGRSPTKLPAASNKAIWVRAQVNVEVDQVLWIQFQGGSGSEVWLDDAQVPLAEKGSADASTGGALLSLGKGSHTLRLKLTGLGQAAPIEAVLDNPWQGTGLAADWGKANPAKRLGLLSDEKGTFQGSQLQKEAAAMGARLKKATDNFTTSLVARELDKPRATRLLQRGEYNLPTGDPLIPGILQVMGAFPKEAPRNRLGLAQWLTSRDHPLVARVLINRIWQRTFGEALVLSPEDFGLQGQHPTHPELLDWLAVEFQESGWNLKHMLRLMVTSKTFRQDSAWRKDVVDPENRLYSRGPSYRLDAEVLRDVGLWASGLLDPHMGGEGVKPYQPSGLWFAMAHPASNTKKYERDKGQRLYRRSLYVYWKRTSPHPMMTLFDAPSRESSCVRRSRTNTSLQSLGLLNETQRLEMARKLAERLLREADQDKDRLQLLYRILASRDPNRAERSACLNLLKAMRQRYAQSEADAKALLATGEAARDESQNLTDQAAWTQVTSTVMASDAAILLY